MRSLMATTMDTPTDKHLRIWKDYIYWDYDNLPWNINGHDKNLEKILKEYSIPKGSVLELGCGYGNDARWFARKGFDVTAIDVCPKAIDRAKEKGKRKNIEYVVEDIHSFSTEKKFDLVYDRGYIHNDQDIKGSRSLKKLFTKLHRLLKPKGKVIIISGNPNQERPPDMEERHMHIAPPLSISKIEQSSFNCFKIKSVKEIVFDIKTRPPLTSFKDSLGWIFVLESTYFSMYRKLKVTSNPYHYEFPSN